MHADETAADGLSVGQDLFFSSKITGTAAALGFRVDSVADLSQAESKLAQGRYRCLFLDLAMPGLAVDEIMAALPADGRPIVVAFGSHVDTARLRAAREAGCDEVMPRSRFSATLPEIMQRCLSG